MENALEASCMCGSIVRLSAAGTVAISRAIGRGFGAGSAADRRLDRGRIAAPIAAKNGS